MSVERVEGPATDPVPVAAVMDALHLVADEGRDGTVAMLIPAATRYLEQASGCAMVAQTLREWFDAPPADGGPLVLSSWPVTAIVAVTTYDDAGVATVLDPDTYHADVASRLARVALRRGVAWPADLRGIQAIAVTVTAGAADPDAVDPLCRLAVTQLVGHWLEYPEAAGESPLQDIPFGVRALMAAAAPVSLA